MVFCVLAVCNLVGGYHHFKGTYCFQAQYRSEDEDSRFLQNVNHLENQVALNFCTKMGAVYLLSLYIIFWNLFHIFINVVFISSCTN